MWPCGPLAPIYWPCGPQGQYRNVPVAHGDIASVRSVTDRDSLNGSSRGRSAGEWARDVVEEA